MIFRRLKPLLANENSAAQVAMEFHLTPTDVTHLPITATGHHMDYLAPWVRGLCIHKVRIARQEIFLPVALGKPRGESESITIIL